MNYGINKLEILAIVEVFKQWRYYIKGTTHRIAIIINHINL